MLRFFAIFTDSHHLKMEGVLKPWCLKPGRHNQSSDSLESCATCVGPVLSCDYRKSHSGKRMH